MGIEQAFGFGQGPAEVIVVGQKANYAPYEERIAYLEGQLRGTVRGYEKGIAELTAVAQLNKDLAERNKIYSNLWVEALRELVVKGRTTREEANAIKSRLENQLPVEDKQLLARLTMY